MRRDPIMAILSIVAAFLCQLGACGAKTKPNIVLLFSDDAGYADFGFQGSRQMRTPNLDRLAESGVRFSQLYVTASVCGPSRAGLLTGRYQQRFGFEENNVPGIMSESGLTGDDMGLPPGLPTIGDRLQALGYRTAIFGKWHMGIADRYHPLKRGFDAFYGFRGGARSFFAYSKKQREKVGRSRWMERDFEGFGEHQDYLTDALADEASAFIEQNRDKPFFAYVSFNAVHLPLEVDPGDSEAFPGLEGKRRKLAQMTLSLDRACGRIVDTLKRLGLEQNTLIVFANDNGGPSDKNASSNYPFAGVKATQLEGGIRVPGFVVWPGEIPAGSVFDKPVSTLDLTPTFVEAAGGDASGIDGLDGVDLVPYLRGEKKGKPHQSLFWKMENRGVVRDGDWKLMRFPDRPAMLFNLARDPSEQYDLADQYPEKIRKLYKKLFEWEMTLERPLFQLRRAEEVWSSERFDQFRKPPAEPHYSVSR
ncbi:MAG: sulfatase-like hydrolase/transferase [Fuerstiella sp.]|nr:sulfatase-like hydrolase/transferase [Fuerstiella sp.]MCP4854157.1 sulfatase-like hydrolase/transferase [Fuerstiella sp.]